MKPKDYFSILLVVLISIVCLDILSYFFIPYRFVGQFSYYRQDINAPHIARKSPRYLFSAHPERGIDLTPNKKDLFLVVEGKRFERFTNELGCFDRNTLGDIKSSQVYDYFAGDSFTWGYLSYEDNFPTLYETQTKRKSLKCGVSHSGQAHQFSKFKEIVKQVGHYPEKVFIGYFLNDPANDYAYPHTTVMDGHEIDVVGFNEKTKSLEHKDMNIVRQTLTEWREQSSSLGLMLWLRTHSLLFNMWQDLTSSQGLRSLYRIQNNYNHSKNYTQNSFTQNNRSILENWVDDSKKYDYQLLLILIPDKIRPLTPNPYAEFERYLAQLGLSFINLAEEMRLSPVPIREFYWEKDPHFNSRGAAFVTEKIIRKL